MVKAYVKGSWNVICDRCGYKRKVHHCRLTWDNLLVCSDTCWEPRQPQDLIRGKRDKQSVPISRPEATRTYINTSTSDMVSQDDL